MKNTLFLMLLLLLAGSVSAQRYYPPRRRYPRQRPARQQRPQDRGDFNRVKFGIVGGLNIANIIDPGDVNFSTDTKLGLNAGISLDIPISYPFAFEGELLFSQKGYSAFTQFGQYSQRSNFIDLPLLLKIQMARGFHFVIGPQVSFLTSTTNTYNNGFSTSVQQTYNQDSQGYNKSLLTGVVGVSFDLNRNVELRGRYAIDLQSNSTYNYGNNPQYNNQVWQIGIGYKF